MGSRTSPCARRVLPPMSLLLAPHPEANACPWRAASSAGAPQAGASRPAPQRAGSCGAALPPAGRAEQRSRPGAAAGSSAARLQMCSPAAGSPPDTLQGQGNWHLVTRTGAVVFVFTHKAGKTLFSVHPDIPFVFSHPRAWYLQPFPLGTARGRAHSMSIPLWTLSATCEQDKRSSFCSHPTVGNAGCYKD